MDWRKVSLKISSALATASATARWVFDTKRRNFVHHDEEYSKLKLHTRAPTLISQKINAGNVNYN